LPNHILIFSRWPVSSVPQRHRDADESELLSVPSVLCRHH